jgi:positive regulator of sigma E, rseC/mucC
MKELGEVIKINKNIATVRVNRHGACGDCHACSLGLENRQFIELEVINTVNAKEKDLVELDVESTDILLGAFIMYGFPLITMLIGLCLSYMVFAKDNTLIATITAFGCMAVSFLIIRLNEDKIKSSTKFLPSISRKISDDLMPLL